MPQFKKGEQMPAPELRDWRAVESLLKLRKQGLSTAQVAARYGMPESSAYKMIRRIRWMASVKLGNGCPIGSVEQNLAMQFLTLWDQFGPTPRGKAKEAWRPMSAEDGKAVSDAMRKVFQQGR